MMMIDAQNGTYSNAVAMRKVGDTLADSVYTQILWGIEQLEYQNIGKQSKPSKIDL